MIDYAAIGAAAVVITAIICATIMVLFKFKTLVLEIPGLKLRINNAETKGHE